MQFKIQILVIELNFLLFSLKLNLNTVVCLAKRPSVRPTHHQQHHESNNDHYPAIAAATTHVCSEKMLSIAPLQLVFQIGVSVVLRSPLSSKWADLFFFVQGTYDVLVNRPIVNRQTTFDVSIQTIVVLIVALFANFYLFLGYPRLCQTKNCIVLHSPGQATCLPPT